MFSFQITTIGLTDLKIIIGGIAANTSVMHAVRSTRGNRLWRGTNARIVVRSRSTRVRCAMLSSGAAVSSSYTWFMFIIGWTTQWIHNTGNKVRWRNYCINLLPPSSNFKTTWAMLPLVKFEWDFLTSNVYSCTKEYTYVTEKITLLYSKFPFKFSSVPKIYSQMDIKLRYKCLFLFYCFIY